MAKSHDKNAGGDLLGVARHVLKPRERFRHSPALWGSLLEKWVMLTGIWGMWKTRPSKDIVVQETSGYYHLLYWFSGIQALASWPPLKFMWLLWPFKSFTIFTLCHNKSTMPGLSSSFENVHFDIMEQFTKWASWWTEGGRECHNTRDHLFNHWRQKCINAKDLEGARPRLPGSNFDFSLCENEPQGLVLLFFFFFQQREWNQAFSLRASEAKYQEESVNIVLGNVFWTRESDSL